MYLVVGSFTCHMTVHATCHEPHAAVAAVGIVQSELAQQFGIRVLIDKQGQTAH